MTTPIDVCNLALLAIGSQSQISSISPSDGSSEADACAVLYQEKIDALHRAAHWNCARFQAPLTLLKAQTGTTANPTGSLPQPPIPWLYEYAYPVDCLAARFIVPLLPSTTVNPPPTTS